LVPREPKASDLEFDLVVTIYVFQGRDQKKLALD